jgi:hypothetical protein
MSVHIESIDRFSQMVDSSDMVLMVLKDQMRARDAWTADCKGGVGESVGTPATPGQAAGAGGKCDAKKLYSVMWAEGVLW